ncbi:MAG: DUF4872 domain-containing protein [Caldilineaceae bacterium]
MTTVAQLPNFPHRVGAHCSSTSIQNVLRYDGVELSEAMVFGLGAGLGFWYIHDETASPTYRFNGRAPDLESNFYRHVGQPLQWVERWSPAAMATALTASRPLLAQTDIYHLPYYEPRVHFPGHGVVVTGIDLTAQTVDLADIHSPDLLTIPLTDFQQAMAHASPPMLWPNRWVAPPKLTPTLVTPDMLRTAILTAAQRMLHPPSAAEGIGAMTHMAEQLPTWGAAPDFVWAARFAYQAIEKRGTGGGGFRTLYGDFLAEAEQYLPELVAVDAATRMKAIGMQWRELAGYFKQVFVEHDATPFASASSLLQKIAIKECMLMEVLARAVQ